MDRFTAESLIQALTGGFLPQDGSILYFDKKVGWKFISITEAAVSWASILGIPTTFDPSLHSLTHQVGADDALATVEPTASAIPASQTSGELAVGWIPTDANLTDENFDVLVDENFDVLVIE